ncbi:serine/threonine-protein kinase [Brachybacterium phenoliresistens]|uniref:serine/threonine-protein kinase n=1 Tax=Brachybacterium phenoliresistens TaxID=396014 RepID=UPI0031D33550
MSTRPPSPHPELPGYQYEKLLGSGGFADVFLYRQFRPQRRVAIKVLLANVLDDSVRRQFDGEANVMATMSTHPSIVTIHTADVSADHRPYLVMEYCPRPNYGVRFRKERITVAEALRVGVQIAGAVETAHRAGILHRDIKPANILVTEYNRPALTDFGISIVADSGEDLEDSQGMSIPWSPPEFFADPPRADQRSDVFSLSATVYSLLAGRTPFELPGRRNTASDLIHRISSEPLAPLLRPDVPEALDRVLSIAMAKDPAGRYDSALAFGRALQQVEMQLSLPITQMDVLDDRGAPAPAAGPGGEDDELDAHTRIRKVATVDPEAAVTGPPAQSAGPGAAGAMTSPPSGPATGAMAPAGSDRYAAIAPPLAGGASASSAPAAGTGGEGDATMLRPVAPPPSPDAGPASPPGSAAEGSGSARRVPAWPFVALAGVLVLVLGIGATIAVRTAFPSAQEAPPTAEIQDPAGGASRLSPPTGVTLQIIAEGQGPEPGKVKVSWTMPADMTEDDYIQLTWVELPDGYGRYSAPVYERVHQSRVIALPPNQPGACLAVRTINDSGGASAPETVCLSGET